MPTKISLPYTYLIGWSKLDKWYYGVRYCKGCCPSDLWTTYFTSSPIVKKFRAEHGEPDVVQLRKTFTTPVQARLWEDKVHHRMNVVKSQRWLNKNYGNTKFITNGHFCGKDREGTVVWVAKNDPRVISGEIVGIQNGTVTVKDQYGNTSQVSKYDPRYLSGELISNTVGTATAYDPTTLQPMGRFSLADNRWETGEWIGSPLFRDQISTTLGMLPRNDPRIASGEARHINVLNAPAMDPITCAPLGRISTTDPRWKSGEIVSMSKGRAAAKDPVTHKPLGNILLSDPRWATKEIVSFAAGTAIAKDAKTGKSVGRVSLHDPRWQTGQIVGIRKQLT
jgi:hypothetical protein